MTRPLVVQERRKEVLRMWSAHMSGSEILASLQERYPKLTLDAVWHDMEWCKNEGKEYIQMRFLPEFGELFLRVKTNLEEASKYSIFQYHNGAETVQTTTIMQPNPVDEEKPIPIRIIKTITRRERPEHALRLFCEANIALLGMGDISSVVDNATRMVAELDRLKKEGKKFVTRTKIKKS